MNGKDLFDGLGTISQKYYDQAENGTITPARKSFRKPFLAAAIIAMMLLLTGCAVVYVLSLKSIKMGEVDLAEPNYTESDIRNVLSMQGVVGSSNYDASKEWLEFSQSYEQHYRDELLSDEEQMKYFAYNCQTRIQADKIDEICEKYSLQLHGKFYHFQNGEEIYQFLGIPGILKNNVAVEDSSMSGYFYQEGSFNLEGHFTLTDADAPVPYPIFFGYRCIMKTVFDHVSVFMSASADYEEWNYTTKDGTTLLLVLVENKHGWIFADRQDDFLSIDIQNFNMDESVTIDKEQLEAVAECFDVTIRPQAFDEATMEAEMEAAQAQEKAAAEEWRKEHPDLWEQPDYAGYAETYLLNIDLNLQMHEDEPGFKISESYYTIRDINGDEVEELLIYQDGRIASIATIEDGVTHSIERGIIFSGVDRGMDLCEENVFIDWHPDYDNDSFRYCTILKYNGHRKAYIRFLLQKDDGIWYDCPTMNPISYEAFDTPLTVQQFQEIIGSYPKIDIESLKLKPLKDLANE